MEILQDAPERSQRIILLAVAGYFVVWLASLVNDSAYLWAASEVLFGLVSFAVGAVLLRRAPSTQRVLRIAGGLLALGGLSQLVYMVLRLGGVFVPAIYYLATGAIFAGVGAYVYVVWVAR